MGPPSPSLAGDGGGTLEAVLHSRTWAITDEDLAQLFGFAPKPWPVWVCQLWVLHCAHHERYQGRPWLPEGAPAWLIGAARSGKPGRKALMEVSGLTQHAARLVLSGT
jgi:hypothetical protein